MKKVTIEINTGNDAFREDIVPELRRILNATANRIEYLHLHEEYPLKDINGNTVGEIKFEV